MYEERFNEFECSQFASDFISSEYIVNPVLFFEIVIFHVQVSRKLSSISYFYALIFSTLQGEPLPNVQVRLCDPDTELEVPQVYVANNLV